MASFLREAAPVQDGDQQIGKEVFVLDSSFLKPKQWLILPVSMSVSLSVSPFTPFYLSHPVSYPNNQSHISTSGKAYLKKNEHFQDTVCDTTWQPPGWAQPRCRSPALPLCVKRLRTVAPSVLDSMKTSAQCIPTPSPEALRGPNMRPEK